MKKHLTTLIMVLFSSLACAGPFDSDKIYYGGGVSFNSLNNFHDAVGYQAFMGYELDLNAGPLMTAAEVGYMDSGSFKLDTTIPVFSSITTAAQGVWVAGVTTYALDDNFDVLGRVGYDFGDDDGVLLGIGVSAAWIKNTRIRAEIIVRDEISSFQMNLVYGLK